MIAAIEGIITRKEPTACVIKCASGVSYALSLSLNTSAKLTQGKLTELACVQILREDADLLYGFLDESEKKMFETLIKLSGDGGLFDARSAGFCALRSYGGCCDANFSSGYRPKDR